MVIAVRGLAEGLDYEPASRLDESVAAPGEPATPGDGTRSGASSSEGRQLARAFPAAVEYLRRNGLVPELDLNRVTYFGDHLGFAFREAQHRGDLDARHWPGYVVVRVASDGTVEHRVVPLPWPRDPEAPERRLRFVEAHPELSGPESELILAGWVQRGMSLEVVLAARGEPDVCWIGVASASLVYTSHYMFLLEFGVQGLSMAW